MGQKQSGLTEKAWISRFWAQYSKLPEAYKDGFVCLAQNLVKESGCGETAVLAILAKKSSGCGCSYSLLDEKLGKTS